MSLENLTFAQTRICPLEAGGKDLTNVGEVEEEEGDANDGVEYGHNLPYRRDGYNMTIA